MDRDCPRPLVNSFDMKSLLKEIESKISGLDESDVSGVLYWNEFLEMAKNHSKEEIDWDEVCTTLDCRKCEDGTVIIYGECRDSKCDDCGQWFETDCCPHDELAGCPTEWWLLEEIETPVH